MTLEPGPREQEAGRRVEAVVARHGAAVEALETADADGVRTALLAVQRALAAAEVPGSGWGPESVAAGLALARESPSLFLGLRAGQRLAALAGDALPPDLRVAFQRGERIGAVAVSEPAGAPPTTVDAGGRLSGRKSFVTNGPVADAVAVLARAGDGETWCVVRPGQAGVGIGPRIRLMGLHGLAVCDLDLEGVAVDVPTERRAPVGALRERYDRDADLAVALAGVGLMRRVLAAARAHAAGHERGGRPVGRHQEVGFRLAEMLAATDAADLLARRAAWAVAGDLPEAGVLVRSARIFCAEGADRVAGSALQLAAGEGLVEGSVVERACRDAKGLLAAGTTMEVSRMRLADELLARF